MAQEEVKKGESCELREFGQSTNTLNATIDVDDETFRRHSRSLVRKLDCTMMPCIWILYMFNYLDRNNISQAKLDSFEKDLGMHDDQFNTAISILNVGYILMQLPSNMILTRVRPSLYLPFWVCVWSVLSGCTAAARNFDDLIAIRFLLGIAEAPFFPGVVFLLSSWYTKRELAFRTAILYSGLILATAFSGLIAAGVFANLDGSLGIAGWRWLFIIDGSLSFFFGILAVFLLPDFPDKSSGLGRWLITEDEKRVAILRLQRDRVSVPEESHSAWYGLKLAVMDYRMWIFVLMLTANHSAYGFNYFYPTIAKGLNLGSTTITLVLTAPPYILATCVSFAVALSSDKLGERGWHISIPMAVAVVGFIISVATLNIAARYFASFLFISGCFSTNAAVFSWASSTLNQSPEKKASAIALINLLAQLGNIWSPYFFRTQDAPRYVLAMILMMAFALISIGTCMAMKWSLRRQNAKLLAEYEEREERPILFTL
ncbi:hypothetical protein PRZ48_005537 [Zasmidium cellare]|uniref:Major facilitator superfamily (MFS) profile domain-containing protein n=1 Tax=Zasmidium cellare TaxID=395010 RepID=A0ABR0EKL8_ZASCE|nr:hypothetical protein PRZ48_005537 [Zasmidium cellare]